MRPAPEEVEGYISAAPEGAREKLRQVRAAILSVAPTSIEAISYRMPYYEYKGRLAWFALQKDYIGLYLRPPAIAEHARELSGYTTTMSAVHIPLDESVPVGLIKKLVRARMRMNRAEERSAKR